MNTPTVGTKRLNYFVVPGLKQPATAKSRYIVKIISGITGIPTEDIIQGSRQREQTYARCLAMLFLRSHANLSFKSVGDYLGNRHHTTVIHGVNVIKGMAEVYPNVRADIERIREVLD